MPYFPALLVGGGSSYWHPCATPWIRGRSAPRRVPSYLSSRYSSLYFASQSVRRGSIPRTPKATFYCRGLYPRHVQAGSDASFEPPPQAFGAVHEPANAEPCTYSPSRPKPCRRREVHQASLHRHHPHAAAVLLACASVNCFLDLSFFSSNRLTSRG